MMDLAGEALWSCTIAEFRCEWVDLFDVVVVDWGGLYEMNCRNQVCCNS